jgi:voltage-gated sodium channel
MRAWQNRLVQIVNSDWFNNLIILVIVLAGVIVGMETNEAFVTRHHTLLYWIEHVILGIFIVEIVLKLLIEKDKPWRFFMSPWNVFDFIIVSISLLPFGSSYVAVLRMARILRVFRLITRLPKLQMIVGALLRSIPSMGYVTILLFLLFYIYAVFAVFNFGKNDPINFGSLSMAMISLFRAVTMDGWSDMMFTNMYGCDVYGYSDHPELCTRPSAAPIAALIFFASFVITGSMIILNFFIGVVLSSMEEMRNEAEISEASERRYGPNQDAVHRDLLTLGQKLQEIQEEVHIIAATLKRTSKPAGS